MGAKAPKASGSVGTPREVWKVGKAELEKGYAGPRGRGDQRLTWSGSSEEEEPEVRESSGAGLP